MKSFLHYSIDYSFVDGYTPFDKIPKDVCFSSCVKQWGSQYWTFCQNLENCSLWECELTKQLGHWMNKQFCSLTFLYFLKKFGSCYKNNFWDSRGQKWKIRYFIVGVIHIIGNKLHRVMYVCWWFITLYFIPT